MSEEGEHRGEPGAVEDFAFANIEAEQAYLGALLYDNSVLEETHWLKPDDFSEDIHGAIFKAAVEDIEEGSTVDAITLKTWAQSEDMADLFKKLGGAVYLADLMRDAPEPVTAKEYARLIQDLSRRRALYRLGLDLERDLKAYELDVDAMIDSFVDLASGIGSARDDLKRGPTQLTPAQMLERERAEEARGVPRTIPTGLSALDERLMGGLPRQANTFLIGGTGMGKTATATNIAFNAAAAGYRVFFWTREMTNRQMLSRFTCLQAASAGVWLDGASILSDHQTETQAQAAERFKIEFSKMENLLVETQSSMSVQGMRARVRQAAKTLGGLDLIIIDYLGQVGVEGAGGMNKTDQNALVSQTFIELLSQYDAAGLLLGQVTRELKKRDNKRPQLGDAREGARVEDDACTVISPYRPLYWLNQQEPDHADEDAYQDWQAECRAAAGGIEILTLKSRDGPTGIDRFTFGEATGSIGNIPVLKSKGADQSDMMEMDYGQ